MISGSIPLLFTPDHALHAPEAEFEQGKIIPYRETPERINNLHQHLLARGLCIPVRASRTASVDDLFAVHSLEMLDFMEAVSHSIQQADVYQYPEFFPVRPNMETRPRDLVGRLGAFCTDIYSPVGAGTWRAATAASGLALQAAELLLRRETSAVYALTRPPGHHAGRDFFGSYCYLNHAALAASRLLSLGRIAIVDIDYHHGNGTQSIFWEEPRVLYTSLHIDPKYDFPFFSGYAHETGGVQAPGSTYNIPLPPGTSSATYLAALEALLSAAQAFHPAALVVSLGFDPYAGDPLSAFRMEAGAYTAIGGRIAALNLPTLIIQEGGYALDALPTLAENFFGGFHAGLLIR